MSATIGPGATNRSSFKAHGGDTKLNYNSPASVAGVITVFEIWCYTAASSVKIGTFSGSGTSWTSRDYESIGSVTSGSKQTFSGLNCDVAANDVIGAYVKTGWLEADGTSNVVGTYTGDAFGAGTKSYTAEAGPTSLYGTGISAAAVTTNSTTDIADTSCTANGNITDTGGSGSDVTERGFCYKAASSGDPTTADSTVKDTGSSYGTGAYSKAISSLSAGTAYRVRAYVKNIYGTFYGTTEGITTTSATKFIPQIMKTQFPGPFGPVVMSLLMGVILWQVKCRRKKELRSQYRFRFINRTGR